jgi:hypothetical protein
LMARSESGASTVPMYAAGVAFMRTIRHREASLRGTLLLASDLDFSFGIVVGHVINSFWLCSHNTEVWIMYWPVIRARAGEGGTRGKARGVHMGRPRSLTPHEHQKGT